MQDQGRKNLKTILLLTLIVSLLGATSAFAYRGMGGMGGGMGCGMGGGMGMRGMMNLTPEQASQVFDLRQKFMNDTAELRKNLMVKRAELAQLWKGENPDEKAIVAKVKELSAIKAQFMEKAVAQRLAMRKIAPQAMGPCPMMGPGMGPGGPGPGKGMGQGRGQGADLMSAPDAVADYEADLNPDLALNF